MTAIGWLTGPLSYPFMQRAVLATLAVGVAAPVAGVWATSRRLVYLTDAMSHAILAGVAARRCSACRCWPVGLVAALVMAVLVALLVVRARLPEDSAIGVAGQGLFALGVIGVSLNAEPRALSHVLFGNPLTVTGADVVTELVLGPSWSAPRSGVPAGAGRHDLRPRPRPNPRRAHRTVDTAVIVGLGLVVVIGLTTVGVLMALTLCIAPAAAARLISARIHRVLILAAGSASPPAWSGCWPATTWACPPARRWGSSRSPRSPPRP